MLMRAIFADDNPVARTLLQAVLEELGHEAAGFEDGQQAWDAYLASPSPLVVLGLRMPGIDGLELCRRIKAHEAGDATFILIVTAHDDPSALVAVLDAGADDYVSRPSSPQSIRARIVIAERWLQQTGALRAAEADLARARWLAGIGETALAMERQISHPLHSILERSARLLEDASFNDDQREQLRIISEQGARLAGVIGRAVNLESPQTVEYVGGARMIDLSGEHRAADPTLLPRLNEEAKRARNDGTDER
jgi:DNA-binding response OmpR family regulator